VRIGELDTDEHVVIVAEIGNNHEGDLGRARELVEAAAQARTDAVKFQTFRTEHFVSASDAQRYELLRRFELPWEAFTELAELAHARGLAFLSTPLDLGSAEFLADVVDAYKIASGDNDFLPLLVSVASHRLPVILSTGMSELAQVERAVATVRAGWPDGEDYGLAVLHCVSAYPVPDAEANLRAITVLAELPGCTIGYSDHTLGLAAAPLAVALGARIVEKHFTLDKELSDFRDHRLSADPSELRELVERIRAAESLLGSAEKRIQPSERETARAARRSIVAARDLPRDHVITDADLGWIRPAGGLAPGEEHRLLGRRLVRDVAAGQRLGVEDVA
jgi:N,N'-diacetyllegionaminate synthase